MKALILSIVLIISLSSCTINTVDDEYLKQWLGKEKRDIEMDLGEPDFCKPDKYGEVCEFSKYRPRWRDTLHLRFYFNNQGICTTISTY